MKEACGGAEESNISARYSSIGRIVLNSSVNIDKFFIIIMIQVRPMA